MPVALVTPLDMPLYCTTYLRLQHAQRACTASMFSCFLHAGVFDVETRSFRREHMDVIDEGLYRAFPELIGPNEARCLHMKPMCREL